MRTSLAGEPTGRMPTELRSMGDFLNRMSSSSPRRDPLVNASGQLIPSISARLMLANLKGTKDTSVVRVAEVRFVS